MRKTTTLYGNTIDYSKLQDLKNMELNDSFWIDTKSSYPVKIRRTHDGLMYTYYVSDSVHSVHVRF